MLNYAMILKGLREKKGLTQSELADEYGTGQSTISRLETGASKEPTVELHDRIIQDARRHGIIATTEDRLNALPILNGVNGHGHRPRNVPIVGYVDAATDDGSIRTVAPGRLGDAVFPTASKSMVAVTIMGDSLGGPFDNWLAFYDDLRAPITPDLIGKLCVVGLANDRVAIKTVKYGKRDGSYSLIAANSKHPIEAATIEWAAKVLLMTPR